MPDEPPATDSAHRMTRRGLLAAVGVSAVAGCSSIDGLSGGTEPTIRAYDLPDIDGESVPEPVVPPSVPVDIDPAYLARTRDRVTGLLAELPMPLGGAEIPNGHVRKHLTDAADIATDSLDDARTARTGLMALRALRDAREHARYAAAGWAVAESGLSVDPLRREHGQVVADARSVWDDHEHVGTDPVRAALVHARIEEGLDRATDTSQPRTGHEGDLLTVATWGETAEGARAHLDDARHFDEQFTASLPDDAGTVEGVLTRAAESLLADARSRRTELPPEPTAEDWGFEEQVVGDLRRQSDHGPDSVADTHGPASAVVDLTARLARFRALDRVRDRIDAGEISRAESADAVRRARTTAYDAFDAAFEASPAPDLARTVLSDVSWRVTSADRELDRYQGEVSPARLYDVVEDYVIATAVARATPAACRQTVDALDAA